MLIVIGLFVPQLFGQFALSLPPGSLRFFSVIASDLLRLCFFIGIALAIIGALRNRKSRQHRTVEI
jgi:hypothetical protein